MNKNTILILFGLLLFSTLRVWAAPISQEKAASYAQQHFKLELVRGAQPVELLYTSSGLPTKGSNDGKDYYVFGNKTRAGFVVVAGDDALPPILAYSDQDNFSTQAMPREIAQYLDGYSAWVKEVRNTRSVPSTQNFRNATEVVTPLLRNLAWGQEYPYNLYTPNKYPTGCVATACAQLMRYYAWPPQGKGTIAGESEFCTKSFDWKKMPNNPASDGTQEEKEAVAYLMRELGKALRMRYSASGGASSSFDAFNALRSYFAYAPSLQLVHASDYSSLAWEQLLISELQARRPVIYSGAPLQGAGHTFVIDGYDGNGYFHVNWGWNGQCDGYFRLHKLESNIGNYSFYQDAIIGICPAVQYSGTPAVHNYTYQELLAHSWDLEPELVTTPFREVGLGGVFTSSAESRFIRLAFAFINEKGEEVSRFLSKGATLLKPGINKLLCEGFNCSGVSNGLYTLRPYIYEEDNKMYYPVTSRDRKRLQIKIAASHRTLEVVEEASQTPQLEVTWKSTSTLHENNYNAVEWSVKSKGSQQYKSYIQAIYSDSESPMPPSSLDECAINELVDIAPGEVTMFRTQIMGPKSSAKKYLHFFANEHSEGKICELPIASISITPAAHYELDLPDIQLIEKTEHVKAGSDYTARFRLSAKGNAGAYIDNWLIYFLDPKGFPGEFEHLRTYIIEPGKSIEITLRKVVNLPKGTKSAFVLAELKDHALKSFGKYPFVVEGGEIQLPIPTYQFTKHSVALAPTAHGSVKCSETKDVKSATQVTITVAPEKDYHLSSLKVHKSGDESLSIATTEDSETTYRFTMPAHDVTVKVVFEKKNATSQPPSISLKPSPHGKVDIFKSVGDAGETEISLRLTPDDSYHLENLKVYKRGEEGVIVSTTKVRDNEYSFVMPDYSVTVQATFGKESSQTPGEDNPQASKPYRLELKSTSNGRVEISNEGNVPANTEVKLSLIPNENCRLALFKVYKLNNPGVAVATTKDNDTDYRFTMPAHDVTVEVKFEKDVPQGTYWLQLEDTPNGKVEISKKDEVKSNTEVRLSLIPNENYHLAALKVYKLTNSKVTIATTKDSDTDYHFTMPAHDVTVKVVFEKNKTLQSHPQAPTTYLLSLQSPSNGTLEADKEGELEAGTEVTLTLSPENGYHFASLKVFKSGAESVTVSTNKVSDAEYRFKMPTHAVTVQATFEKDIPQAPTTYLLSLQSPSNGTLEADKEGELEADTQVTLTLTPDADYHFASLKVFKSGDEGVTVSTNKVSDTEYRFKMPTHAVTVQVVFEKDEKNGDKVNEDANDNDDDKIDEDRIDEGDDDKIEDDGNPLLAEPKTYPITIQPTEHGTIEIVNGNEGLEKDTWVMLEIEPEEDYRLSSLLIYKSGSKKKGKINYLKLSDSEYQFSMPGYAITVEAKFEKEEALEEETEGY